MRQTIGIRQKLPLAKTLPLSFQHLMAMFGATVLVPLLFKINPAIALLMNGIGTLIYSWVTKGGIPAYLGSSFAFIAPTMIILSKGGFAHAQSGYIGFGVLFILVSLLIRWVGTRWIDIVMPAPVMGAIVAVIGLELAPVAAGMAGLVGEGRDPNVVFVALCTLAMGVIGSVVFRGFLQVIPVLIAVIGGYVLALAKGMVDFSPVISAPWVRIPTMTLPVWDWNAVIMIAPAALVVLAEHIGHLVVTSNITGTDLVKDPGLDRSLLGDGISNVLSGLVGSPPNTTYGENIGVMAITRVYSVWVIRGAALLAIGMSCLGKVAAVIQTVPTAVMGGICILLFGVIAVSGIRMLVEQRVNYSGTVPMVSSALVLTIGVSGARISIGAVEMKGMALAAVVGIALSLLIYVLGRIGLLNQSVEGQSGA